MDNKAGISSTNPALAPVLGPVELAHPLKLLQGYSNKDKHQSIRVAVPRSGGGRVDRLPAGSRHFVQLEVGDILSEDTWGHRVDIEQTTAAQIERPDPYTALVAPGSEISRLASYVADTVVPRLVTGRALPSSLPMKVDLDDSGQSDLERLTAGDRRPARDRLAPLMTEMTIQAMKRPVKFPPIVVEDG